MTITHYLSDEAETIHFASKLAKKLQAGMVVFLHGDLGAGKTTMVRGILQALGYRGRVKSPTYAIIEPYEVGKARYFHLDLYRLADASELLHLGLDEIFQHDTICFIEWPERGEKVLPKADVDIYLSQQAKGRELKITGLDL